MNSQTPAVNEAEIAAAPKRTHARLGAFLGAIAGLFFVRWMLSGIDPTIGDHKPMFPAVVYLLCVFTVFMFCIITVIGQQIGSGVDR